jgi:hypothetical protein
MRIVEDDLPARFGGFGFRFCLSLGVSMHRRGRLPARFGGFGFRFCFSLGVSFSLSPFLSVIVLCRNGRAPAVGIG